MNDSEIVLNNIYNRKSVRTYTDDEISKEDLLKIVKAGMCAPSACNFQPWEFIIIRDSETLEDMGKIHKYSKMFKNAKAGIIVLGDLNKTIKDEKEFWVQDCAAVTENILLSASALGIGSVWTGIYPVDVRITALKKYFKLPDHICPFSLIALGYPDNENEVKDKMDENKIHWEKW